MKQGKTSIQRQLRTIRLAKGLVVCLLGLSFVLEFAILSLISMHKTQEIVVTASYDQVTGQLRTVSYTISHTINKKYQAFLAYFKKKYEEKSQSGSDNYQFNAFNLFFVDKFSFQFQKAFCLEGQNLHSSYQEPFTQKAVAKIFHPPQS